MNTAAPYYLAYLLEKHGFYYYEPDDLKNMQNKQLELTKKSTGESYGTFTDEEFGKDYHELCSLCRQLNIKIPEVVWYD